MSPTPVFWPGESHGLYNSWGCKETQLSDFHFLFSFKSKEQGPELSFSERASGGLCIPLFYSTHLIRSHFCLETLSSSVPGEFRFLMSHHSNSSVRDKSYR